MRIGYAVLGLWLACGNVFADSQSWLPPGVSTGRIHFGQPDRAAVLLVHGLGATGDSTWRKPSLTGANWDLSTTPADRSLGGGHRGPGVGFYDFGLSNRLDVDASNLFDALSNAGFTVAMWDQPQRNFSAALPSALAALDKFVADTVQVNPDAPPPIALIGHSRGGLLIRAVLKQRGMLGRVRWVMTLNSPHSGSDMAEFGSRCGTDWASTIPVGPFDNQRDRLVATVRAGLGPIDAIVNNPAQAELGPSSPLIASLASGERKLPFVRYVTWGGDSPRYTRLYAWHYTADSAWVSGWDHSTIPWSPLFSWTIRATELSPFASPLLDALPNCVPEVSPGQGDGLVADSRSHLPFEDRHLTHSLNHASVLWDGQTRAEIIDELMQPLTPIPVLTTSPSTGFLIAFTNVPFTANPPGVPVTWSVESGPGTISSTGVYEVPYAPWAHVVIRADAQDGSGRVARGTFTLWYPRLQQPWP
jgi:hypothetical protein